jgi:hypothetical protein
MAQVDHDVDEWRECRTTIGRMDGILADTRKYGFTLITALLTASALVPTADPTFARPAAAAAVTVLVLVLFLIDRYWWVMLREAIDRATQLEQTLDLQITGLLIRAAERTHNTLWASIVYSAFIFVAFSIGFMALLPRFLTLGMLFLWVVFIGGLVVLWWIHCWFEHEIAEIKDRSLARGAVSPRGDPQARPSRGWLLSCMAIARRVGIMQGTTKGRPAQMRQQRDRDLY